MNAQQQLAQQIHHEVLRMQNMFANVIAEMESDLERLKKNDKVPPELIAKRDMQIDTLIKYNNKVDDMLQAYKLAMLNARVEIITLDGMLWQALKSEKTAFETLMHTLVKIPKKAQTAGGS